MSLHVALWLMPYGAPRREMIVASLKSLDATKIYVNNKWQRQLKTDTDLSYLLKKGILVKKRGSPGGNKRQTYLELSNGTR